MDELADLFEARLRESARLCAELGYAPTVFLAMLDRHGGVAAARQLVASGEIQSGVRRVAAMGRLDLTTEQIMLNPQFAPLFEAQLLGAARWRLDQILSGHA